MADYSQLVQTGHRPASVHACQFIKLGLVMYQTTDASLVSTKHPYAAAWQKAAVHDLSHQQPLLCVEQLSLPQAAPHVANAAQLLEDRSHMK